VVQGLQIGGTSITMTTSAKALLIRPARKMERRSGVLSNLAAAGFFSRIWFLIHHAAPMKIQDLNAASVPQLAAACY
jgi:hypothetical protein